MTSTTNTPARPPRRMLTPLQLWLLLAVLALVLVGGVIVQVAVRHLQGEAEAAAVRWADLALRVLPALGDASGRAAGRRPADAAGPAGRGRDGPGAAGRPGPPARRHVGLAGARRR